jgi:hypothetical protein
MYVYVTELVPYLSMYDLPATVMPAVWALVPAASYPPHSRMESPPGSLLIGGRDTLGAAAGDDGDPQAASSPAPAAAAPRLPVRN